MDDVVFVETNVDYQYTFPAMATEFGLWLWGREREFLASVGQQVKEEILRIEQLLSRFDPASEISRINQEAKYRPVKVERELFDILADCVNWYHLTEGYFDISIYSHEGKGLSDRICINRDEYTISFQFGEVSLDMGGYGKGYALDKVKNVLNTYGIDHYFVQGGTSSAIAKGLNHQQPWSIEYRTSTEQLIIQLIDQCFSCSQNTFTQVETHILTPRPWLSDSNSDSFSCYALGPDALSVEVYTTAIIAMGPDLAENYIKKIPEGFSVSMFSPSL